MKQIERFARLYPQLLSRMSRIRTLVHDGVDLTYNQYKTLLTVADRGACSLGDLGRELEVAASSASQMVDRLVGQGLLDRALDSDNRRQVTIRLTAQGRAQIERFQQNTLQGYRKLLQRLSENEQEQLVQSFETIADILAKVTEKEK